MRADSPHQFARLGSWETNPRTLSTRWSDELHPLFGTEAANLEPTHQRLLERVHPDDRAAVEAAFRNSLRTRQPVSLEHRIVTADGRSRFVEQRWQVIAGDDGAPHRIVGTCEDITERKQAEVRVRANETLFRMAGRAARLGGWMIDVKLRTLTWSDEVCAIHDLPPGYVPTIEEGLSYYTPEHRAEVSQKMRACELEGTSYDLELIKFTATGRRIWVRTIGEAVRDAAGEIIGLQGAIQDITERKEAERELARINRALQMLSRCNDATIRAESEAELLNQICRIGVEGAGYRMVSVGFARDDQAKTIEVVAHHGSENGYFDQLKLSWSADVPEGQGPAGQCIREGVLRCLDTEKDRTFTPWAARAKLHNFRSLTCLPLRDGPRTFGLLALYSCDVSQPRPEELSLLQELADNLAFGITNLRARTQQRAAQQKLAEQAALLDHATDAIYVYDLVRGITSWNRSAEQLYGWPAPLALHKSPEALLARPESLAARRQALRVLLETGEWAGELKDVSKAGRPLTIEARWTLLRDDQGQPSAVLTINTDVTEKRRLETQVLRSQRMESIGTLAGGIAHDLNNVLAPIMMSVAELKGLALAEGDRELLDTLQFSAQRGADLIKQLLTFARGTEGERRVVAPQSVVAEVQALVRDTFPRSIELNTRAPPGGWSVLGDATELHQVLMNLCVNARDAMPDGGRLALSLENVVLPKDHPELPVDASPGDWVLLAVSDSGPGIPLDLRERIFEPFFTTKALGKGTGLGLSTTLNIVKRHGGFITLDCDAGTTFKVYLPALSPSVTGTHASEARAEATLQRGRGELVLVVDDEPAIRAVAKKTLERFGYRVLSAGSGAEALQIFASNAAIALVLTDLSMPGMDGATLIVALKEKDPLVRVLCSSGFASDTQLAQVRAAGVHHVLDKPYTAEALLRAVHTSIHQ